MLTAKALFESEEYMALGRLKCTRMLEYVGSRSHNKLKAQARSSLDPGTMIGVAMCVHVDHVAGQLDC